MSEIINGEVKCRVDQLLIGQRVDLQNDLFADPEGYLGSQYPDGEDEGESSEHPEFEFEFAVVESITDETANGEACLVVNFLISGGEFTCGFPPEHMVDVDGEQPTVRICLWHSPKGWRFDSAEDHGGYDRISPSNPESSREAAQDAARVLFAPAMVAFVDGIPYHYGDGDADQ